MANRPKTGAPFTSFSCAKEKYWVLRSSVRHREKKSTTVSNKKQMNEIYFIRVSVNSTSEQVVLSISSFRPFSSVSNCSHPCDLFTWDSAAEFFT